MKTNITFKKLAKLSEELLAQQVPVTLEEARDQAKMVKERSNKDADEEKNYEPIRYKNMKANIQFAHPEWTAEQIENEFKRRLK